MVLILNIGTVQEYKLEIDKEEFTFRLDFDALIKFNERYENSMEVFNNFLQGKKEYDCIIKILSCSCKNEKVTEEFLKHNISFDFPTMKILDLISRDMIQGSLILDKKENKEETNKEKN